MPKKIIIKFQNTIISTEVFACTNIHFCLLIHHVRKVISFSNHSKQSIPNDHLHWKFSMLIAKSELNISYKQFWKWLNDWKLIPKIHSNRKITNTVYWMHVCVWCSTFFQEIVNTNRFSVSTFMLLTANDRLTCCHTHSCQPFLFILSSMNVIFYHTYTYPSRVSLSLSFYIYNTSLYSMFHGCLWCCHHFVNGVFVYGWRNKTYVERILIFTVEYVSKYGFSRLLFLFRAFTFTIQISKWLAVVRRGSMCKLV